MSRLCTAAVQLIEQACQIEPSVKARAIDKPDELGRHRTIEFDSATSQWLAPIMEVIDDPRVEAVYYEGEGRATIVFVGDTDRHTDYPLLSVGRVLGKLGG